jgi:hypothetical protein
MSALAGESAVLMRGDTLVAMDEGTKPRADDNQEGKIRGKGAARNSRKGGAPKESQVGRVLQNVYQQTIDEDVPAEMLDLLNKLK